MTASGAAAGGGEFAVVACGPPQRTEQAELFNACFKKRLDAAALDWRYDQNPHGAAVSFVTRADGRAVSGYACSPRRALSRGDEATLATVGETGDVMTHPDWRKRGLFSELDRAAREATRQQGWQAIFGLPNRRSAHIFLELGWKQAGTLRTWTFLLSGDARARAERARHAGRLAALIAPLQARLARARRKQLAAQLVGLELRPLAAFPPEALALARTVEPRFDWMVRRDPDYLDWRFLKSPSGLHRALGLYRAGRLAAWVVVQLPRPGEGGGWLVDLLAPQEQDAQAAIAAALAELERAGASFVQASAVDGSWWAAALARAAFLPPSPEHQLIVIVHPHAQEHPLAQAAADASRWYLTDGDRDDETMG